MYNNYHTIEEKEKAARRKAEEYRKAAGHIPAVMRVVREFDGKVYNCRFGKALEEATGGEVHANKTAYTVEIFTYAQGYSSIDLATVRTADLTDGKRIPAEKLLQSARERREGLLKKASEIEAMMDQAPHIREYFEEMRKKLQDFSNRLPSEIKDIYGIPYCVRFS